MWDTVGKWTLGPKRMDLLLKKTTIMILQATYHFVGEYESNTNYLRGRHDSTNLNSSNI